MLSVPPVRRRVEMKMKTGKKNFLILLAAAAMFLLLPLAVSAESLSEKEGGNRPSDPDFATISGRSSLTFAGSYHPNDGDGDETPWNSQYALFDTDCLRLDVKTTGVLCVHVRIDSVPSLFCPQYVITYLKESSEPFDDKSWMNSLQIGSDGKSMHFYTQRNGAGYGRFETFLEPGEYDLYSKCFGFASTYQYDIQFLPHAQSAPGTTLFQKPGAEYTLGQIFSGAVNNGYRVFTQDGTPYQNFRDTCEHYVHFTVEGEGDYTIDLWANNNATVEIEETGEYVENWRTVSATPLTAVSDTYVTGIDIGKLQTFDYRSKKVHLPAGTYTARIYGMEHYVCTAQYTLTCYRFSISRAADDSLRKTQTITTGKTSYSKAYGSKAFFLKAKTSGDGKLTFSSGNTKVAKVSPAGKVTVKNPGETVITIKASETPSCKAAVLEVKVSVKPGTPSGLQVKSSSKKKVSVSWKKTAKATGYQVQYTSAWILNPNWDGKNPDDLFKPDFGASGAKTASVKSLSKKIGGLTSGAACYVRVRAYYKSGSTSAYSGWSKAVKAAVK